MRKKFLSILGSLALAGAGAEEIDFSLFVQDSAESPSVRLEARTNRTVVARAVTRTEFIGSPDGVSSKEWDTTAVANGWQSVTVGETNATLLVLNAPDFEVEGGRLASSKTWTQDSIHWIRNWVVVPDGKTLTIADGTIVKFGENTGIKVEEGGTLNINGKTDSRVILTQFADDTAGGDSDFNATNATYGGWSVTAVSGGTINDTFTHVRYGTVGTLPTLSLPVSVTAQRSEGKARIPVTLSAAKTSRCSLHWKATDGSAKYETDYTQNEGEAIWTGSSDTTVFFEIPLNTVSEDTDIKNFVVELVSVEDVNPNPTRLKTTVTIVSGTSLVWPTCAESEQSAEVRLEARSEGTVGKALAHGIELKSAGTNTQAIAWDTTAEPNGWQTLTASDDASQQAQVLVANDATLSIEGGRLQSTAVEWSSNVIHVVRNWVVVPSEHTLTITTNAVVKFCENTGIKVEDGGQLIVLGATNAPAVFTAITDDTIGGDTDRRVCEATNDFYSINVVSGGTFTDTGAAFRYAAIAAHPTVSLPSGCEINESNERVVIPITVSGTRTTPFTIYWRTIDDSAKYPDDYTLNAGSVTFTSTSAGTQYITVPVANDGVEEETEKFAVEIYDAQGANISRTAYRCTVTVRDSTSALVPVPTCAESEQSAEVRLDNRREGFIGKALAHGVELKSAGTNTQAVTWDTTAEAEGWQTVTASDAPEQTEKLLVRNDEAIAIEGGRLQSTATEWSSNVTHLVRNWVVVPSGYTLTITTNAVVKFCEATGIKVEDGGKLELLGDLTNNVYLTLANDDTVGGDTDAEENRAWDEAASNTTYSITVVSGGTFTDAHAVIRGTSVATFGTVSVSADAIVDKEAGTVRIPVFVAGARTSVFSVDWKTSDGLTGQIVWNASSEGTKWIELALDDCSENFTVELIESRGINISASAKTTAVKVYENAVKAVVCAESESSAEVRLENREEGTFGKAVVHGTEYKADGSEHQPAEWDTITSEDGWQTLTDADAAGTTAQVLVRNASSIAIEGGRLQSTARQIPTNDTVITVYDQPTWSNNVTHVVRNWVVVPSDVTLRIQAGTVVKFAEHTGFKIEPNGYLYVQGTTNAPVVYTSVADDTIGGDSDLRTATPQYGDYAINVVSGGTYSDTCCAVRYATFSNLGTASIPANVIASEKSGYVRIPVSISTDRTTSFCVDWRAKAGTAKEGSDYTLASGRIAWNTKTEGTKYIEIPLAVDDEKEEIESFTVELYESQGINISTTALSCTVTIYDDTLLPEMTFAESDQTAETRLENRDIDFSPGAALVTGVENVSDDGDGANHRAWDTTAAANGWQSFAEAGSPQVWVVNDSAIAIEGGRLQSTAVVWSNGVTHLVRNWVVVPNGYTLTINAGTVVKFCDETGIYVENGGRLVCNGTAAANVILTSVNDDTAGGDTDGLDEAPDYGNYYIHVVSGGTFTDTYTQMRYGESETFGTVSVASKVIAKKDAGWVRIPVTISSSRTTPFAVNWSTYGDTALADEDYLTASGRVEWASCKDGTQYIEIPLDRMSPTSDGERFYLTLDVGSGININLDAALCEIYLYDTRDTFTGDIQGYAESEWCAFAALDSDAGHDVRFVEDDEVIRYSTKWATNGVACRVAVVDMTNDVAILHEETENAEGSFVWSRDDYEDGRYDLYHTIADADGVSVLSNGVTFIVNRDVICHAGTLSADETWSADKVHLVLRTVYVPSTCTLTIVPNAIVKLMPGASIVIEDGGLGICKGAIFTHAYDDTIGDDTFFDGSNKIPVEGEYSLGGEWEEDESTQYRYEAPAEVGGTLTGQNTWRGYKTYVVKNNITLANGATLNVEPGAIVKFGDGMSLTVNSGAMLNAHGTRASPVIFTSIKDDEHGGDTNGDGDETIPYAGDWSKISTSGGTANMSHVHILYSSKNSTTGAINMNGGTVTFVNGLIAHGQYDAVGVESGHFYMTNSIIYDCLLACRHWPKDPIVNCVIYDCGRLTQGGGQTFINCIFSRITETWEAFGFPGSTYKNCCFWNEDGSVVNGQDAKNVCGSNGNIWGDPLFEDPDNLNFRLKTDSPCIDAGTSENAPEYDYYNQPRNGEPDIGIYEAQVRPTKSDIDLSILSASADASVVIGDYLQVSWTVENVGSMDATGHWRDTFELIDANGATVKLGSYTVTGGIVSGGKRVFTTNFRVPSAAVGAARLRVKVNPERDIFEGSATENNVAYADVSIDIALASYTEDDYSMIAIGAGSSTALTLSSDSGITALIIKGGSDISAYGAYGYVPKTLRNDVTAVRLEDGSLLLTLPSTAGTGDFTFVIANDGTGSETVTIEPVTESLEITEVTPTCLANTGDGYLTIRGIALDKVTAVRLVGSTTYEAATIDATASGELTVTIPLADATAGMYALEVEDEEGEVSRLDDAVEVYKPKTGPKLEARLETSSVIRKGRTYIGRIVYANTGDTDMPAPIFVVRGDANRIRLSLSSDTVPMTNVISVVGIDASCPKGVLKAGSSRSIPFYYSASETYDLKLTVLDSSNSKLRDSVFPTWQSFSDALADAATFMNGQDDDICDFSRLNLMAMRKAYGQAVGIIRGRLINRSTQLPMALVRIMLTDEDGSYVGSDTTTESGCFAFLGLDTNAVYRLTSDQVQLDRSGVQASVGEHARLNVYATSFGTLVCSVKGCSPKNVKVWGVTGDGSYELALEGDCFIRAGCPDGIYELKTSIDDYYCVTSSCRITVLNGLVTNGAPILDAVPCGRAHFVCRDELGEPVSGLECFLSSSTGLTCGNGSTDTNGVCDISAFAGQYTAGVMAGYQLQSPQRVDVETGSTREVNLTVSRLPMFVTGRMGVVPLPVKFELDYTNGMRTITACYWDFDADGVWDGSGFVMTNTYTTEGMYDVRQLVRYEDGSEEIFTAHSVVDAWKEEVRETVEGVVTLDEDSGYEIVERTATSLTVQLTGTTIPVGFEDGMMVIDPESPLTPRRITRIEAETSRRVILSTEYVAIASAYKKLRITSAVPMAAGENDGGGGSRGGNRDINFSISVPLRPISASAVFGDVTGTVKSSNNTLTPRLSIHYEGSTLVAAEATFTVVYPECSVEIEVSRSEECESTLTEGTVLCSYSLFDQTFLIGSIPFRVTLKGEVSVSGSLTASIHLEDTVGVSYRNGVFALVNRNNSHLMGLSGKGSIKPKIELTGAVGVAKDVNGKDYGLHVLDVSGNVFLKAYAQFDHRTSEYEADTLKAGLTIGVGVEANLLHVFAGDNEYKPLCYSPDDYERDLFAWVWTTPLPMFRVRRQSTSEDSSTYKLTSITILSDHDGRSGSAWYVNDQHVGNEESCVHDFACKPDDSVAYDVKLTEDYYYKPLKNYNFSMFRVKKSRLRTIRVKGKNIKDSGNKESGGDGSSGSGDGGDGDGDEDEGSYDANFSTNGLSIAGMGQNAFLGSELLKWLVKLGLDMETVMLAAEVMMLYHEAHGTSLTSVDPNEMGGIMGRGDAGTQRYVKPGEWMTYTVYFENKSTATAAAQEVKVTNPLSKYLDWSTFEMGEVAFNNQIDLGLSGKQNGTSEVALNGTSYQVRSKVTLDKTDGKVDWYLRIVDPTTATTWPDDVFAGLLPPNDSTYRGEGHLTYRIKVRDDVPVDTKITNAASIIFDYNDPIETEPAWWNLVGEFNLLKVDCGNGETNTLDLVANVPFGTLPTPKKKGYKFLGWFFGPNGTGGEVRADTVVPSGLESIYPQWEEDFVYLWVDGEREDYLRDDEVAVATFNNVTNGWTNLVCRGWVGTGDVPATGTSNEVSLVLTQDSELCWQYQTNYWVAVDANVSFASGEGDAIETIASTCAGGRVAVKDAAGATITNELWAAAGTNLTAEATANEGWLFAGWRDVETGADRGADGVRALPVTQPWLLEAVFTSKVFVVTFDLGEHGTRSGGGELVQTVEWGRAAIAPTVATAVGWAFQGWDVAFDRVKSAITVKAQYLAGGYTITYENERGCFNVNPKAYTVEDEIEFVALTNTPGWKFLGWSPAKIERGSTGDTNIVAQWEQIKYRVDIGGVVDNTCTNGQIVTAETFAAVTNGYTNVVCVGWIGTGDVPASGAGNKVTLTVTQESSLTWLYATYYWVSVDANVSFASGEDDAIETIASTCAGGSVALKDAAGVAITNELWAVADTNLTAEATANEGWLFAGWREVDPWTRLSQSRQEGVTVSTSDAIGTIASTCMFDVQVPIFLEAVFTSKVFVVTFDLGEHGTRSGGGELTQTVEWGKAATAPTVVPAVGWAFEGWDVAFDCVKSAIIVKAQYLAGGYTITYENERGCFNENPKAYTVEDEIEFVALTNAPGWKFLGWSLAKIERGMMGDLTVTALWDRTGVLFKESELTVAEGGHIDLLVSGGSVEKASSVVVYLTYQTAAVADIDLKTAKVDGVTPKGGIKFPVTLSWSAGEIGTKTISIPVKTDKTVEDDETLVFQLAAAQGQELGEAKVCFATIHDVGYDALKEKIGSGTATKAEQSAWKKLAVNVGIPYVAGLANPADGGKVAGSGYCAAGKKVTLKATANKNYAFAGWIAADDSTAIDGSRRQSAAVGTASTPIMTPTLVFDRSAKPAKSDAKQTVITNISEGVTYYATFKSDPEIFVTASCDEAKGAELTGKGAGKFVAGTVTGAGKYAAGKKKIALKATANKGYVFVGWYPVDAIVSIASEEDGSIPSDAIVSIAPTCLSRLASYTIAEMPTNDVELTAMFITSGLDKSNIVATVNGMAFGDSVGGGTPTLPTNIWTGVYLEWPVAASALSETTVKVAGLPSGLKFTAKPVTTKVTTGSGKTKVTTIVTNIAANTIYGAPSAASKTKKVKVEGEGEQWKDVPSQVKVTVTTAGKSSQTYQIDITVDPLPSWVVGTFAGPSYAVGDGTPTLPGTGAGEDGYYVVGSASRADCVETNGTVSVTIGANGKISAKQPVNGKSASFAASYFDSYAADESTFHATLTAKVGKEVVTNEIAVGGAEMTVGDGTPTLPDTVVTNGVIEADLFDARQYNWKIEPWKSIGKVLDKETLTYYILSDGTVSDDDVVEGFVPLSDGVTYVGKASSPQVDGSNVTGKVTLKFAASGAVTVSGEFAQLDANGQPVYKKGKLQTVKATGSAILVPAGDDYGLVFVYLAPKGLQPHVRCVEASWARQTATWEYGGGEPWYVCFKPVIYLYPETNTTCNVRLSLDGELTCTYPEHGADGWRDFVASPDGTLTFLDGSRYYCLYWEGTVNAKWDFSQGYCVKGSETASFLADVLPVMGLTFREANEFIVYWLPQMQDNPYNVIAFQGENYVKAARLQVEPQPDSVLRVFMAWYPSERPVDVPAPVFDSFERKGFALVEWGGAKVDASAGRDGRAGHGS